jgi:chemotaxis protein histidine kinase CheA
VQATKQQQIVGYFIEEAKEHLDTIEQSLLNLKLTVTDADQLNELFRAAHSIKGGAAMLGFQSIQKIGHHLEDCFKILTDHSIAVDQTIENLFLQGFDSLKALVEELQSPYGLQPEEANKVVQAADPVFGQLQTHLTRQIQGGGAAVIAPPQAHPRLSTLLPTALKKMLLLFKQGDSSTTRKQLVSLCAQMSQLHASSEWLGLLQIAQLAIANAQNTYPTLAPAVIRELKLAGDLLLADRCLSIVPSQKLQQLTLTPNSPAIESPSVSSSFGNPRSRTLTIPTEPKAAARALLDVFTKDELIELAEFLMQAVHQR